MTILALNAGSSSLKFALFEGKDRRLAGKVSGIGEAPVLKAGDIEEHWDDDAPEKLTLRLLAWIETRHAGQPLEAVGHRVVHGGPDFVAPVRVDDDVLARLDALTPLAPLHQPASLAPIRRIAQERPKLAQIACFDTAFHHDLEPPFSRYPLPRKLIEDGIRRYGFHGLSYEAIAGKLAARNDGAERDRIVVAHLGSGASLCALRGLKSVATTMGFTALDGVMMATRPGSLDPGILLYLMQVKGYDAGRLEHMLYHESGLLGLSGISGDVEKLLTSGEAAAHEALDLYTLSIAQNVAAMTVALGGLDRLVFTGGVGEHAAWVRAAVARRLTWLGLVIDESRNDRNDMSINRSDSRVRVEMIPTDEESVIACHCMQMLARTR